MQVVSVVVSTRSSMIVLAISIVVSQWRSLLILIFYVHPEYLRSMSQMWRNRVVDLQSKCVKNTIGSVTFYLKILVTDLYRY